MTTQTSNALPTHQKNRNYFIRYPTFLSSFEFYRLGMDKLLSLFVMLGCASLLAMVILATEKYCLKKNH